MKNDSVSSSKCQSGKEKRQWAYITYQTAYPQRKPSCPHQNEHIKIPLKLMVVRIICTCNNGKTGWTVLPV